ncbi:PspC domain-containing protein [Psychromicrobium sp. YIM B11713]|uniref:PspC domain-containing protein n=1 Tax=Psychromicrobium sp. YIM B11713 TaxID=3145233 RepID=UPI00374E53DB
MSETPTNPYPQPDKSDESSSPGPGADSSGFTSRTASPGGTAAAANNFFGWLRSLGIVRGSDRWIGGVASGVAARWGIDPIIVRGIIVVASIFFGIGLLAYGLAWALLPEPDGRIHVQEVGKGTWSSGMTGATIFALLGILPFWRGLIFFNIFDSGWWFPWPLIWLAGIVGVIIWAVNRGKTSRPRSSQSDTYRPTPYRPTATTGQAANGSTATGPTQPYQSFTQSSAAQSLGESAVTEAQPAFSSSVSPPSTQPLSTAPFSMADFARQPRVPRSPGAGPIILCITLGLAILLAGGLFLAELLGFIHGPIAVVAWSAAGVVCGIGIVVAALRGRRSGGLGFFAVCSLLVAAVMAMVPSIPSNAAWTFARTASWTANDASEIQQGFVVTAGSGLIDVRQLRAPQQSVTVPVLINAGSVEISVPKSLPVRIENDMLAGDVESWDAASDGTQANKHKMAYGNQAYQLNSGASGPALIIKVSGLGKLSVISYREENK